MPMSDLSTPEDFAHQAEQSSPSLVWELADFLLHNKAWWITPIVAVLLLVALLVVVGATGAGPFVYTLF
ncbi:MAG TPA: DUF5989 family protein [Planctomycetaceae bacterium]|jgi:hypothetical protein|nr:DUF5989 family protein [Planctomycetaceae bacterium]